MSGMRPRLLVDEIVERLERMIVEGEIAAGTKLSEVSLASSLNVSRAPLREAIRTLEGRRLVTRTPNSGVRVVMLTYSDVKQLLMTREALEGMACRQCAEEMTLAEVDALKQCLERVTRNRKRNAGVAFPLGTAGQDFHLQILRGCRNRWLTDTLIQDIYPLLRIARFQSTSLGREMREAYQEHFAIVERIEKRDPDGAESVMRNHIAAVRAGLLAHFRELPPKTAASRQGKVVMRTSRS
jgi:DNA-binding GntR family transcriptional regulator